MKNQVFLNSLPCKYEFAEFTCKKSVIVSNMEPKKSAKFIKNGQHDCLAMSCRLNIKWASNAIISKQKLHCHQLHCIFLNYVSRIPFWNGNVMSDLTSTQMKKAEDWGGAIKKYWVVLTFVIIGSKNLWSKQSRASSKER